MSRRPLEERKALLAQRVAAAVGLGGRIESQTETMAVIVSGRRVNHLLHFLVGFPTLGFWWLVWIYLAITGGEKRRVVTVDDYGNILEQGQGGSTGGSTASSNGGLGGIIGNWWRWSTGGEGSKWRPAIGLGGPVLLVGVIIAMASSGGADEPTDQASLPATATVAPTSTPRPVAPTATSPPGVEDCFSKWDGHLDALEDLVRPYLNDEDSMQTHETRFSSQPDADGYHLVTMEYSAKNALGGRVKVLATGFVHESTCEVLLVDTGL